MLTERRLGQIVQGGLDGRCGITRAQLAEEFLGARIQGNDGDVGRRRGAADAIRTREAQSRTAADVIVRDM